MNKEQKIEFLKGLCDGTRSFSELGIIDTPLLDYDFCSTLELRRLLHILRKFGEVDQWPQEEKDYLEWLRGDIPLREPRPPFSERRTFDCHHLPGELLVIRYKDPNKKPLFQLEHGYDQEDHPNVVYPHYNKYFVHYDLSEWKSYIQFDQLTEEELEQMCLQLLSENELLTQNKNNGTKT